MQGLAGKAPRVNATNNHWEVYDNNTQTWVDTGIAATGAKGDDGYTPVVTASQTTGGVLLTISDGRPGGVINTYFIRDGTNGTDGEDGHSPFINNTGYWVLWNDSTGAWVTTNYKAAGTDGEDGHSPYIGENGHWFAWSESLAMYDDTGVAAQGPQGDSYVLTNQDKQDIASQAASQVEPLVPTRIGQLQDDVGLVHYNSQTLTDAQQAQARANIGAASMSDLGTVFTLKGGVATVNDLPQTGNSVGDVWYVESVSAGFIWITSTAYPNGYWEELGETIDLSDMATKTWVGQQDYLTLSDLPIYNGGVT